MKIAIIGQKGIFGQQGGGVETHVEDLALGLAQKGHEVLVYVRPYYCRLKIKRIRKYRGITLISLPTIRSKHFDAITHTFLATLDVILRRDIDIIHYHSIGPAFLLLIPKIFKRKAKIIFTFHSQDYYHDKWSGIARLCLRVGEKIGCLFSDEVIVVSKNIKKYVDEKYKIQADFVPNGVRIPNLEKANMIKKNGLRKNNYILCVSRMIPDKNIHLLISAYEKINWKKNQRPKKLVIVGGSSYTDLYSRYLVHRKGKNKNIIFTGSIPNNSKMLKELYSNAYLYVSSSKTEGLSISLLEAASFGLPVLNSDIIENRDVAGGNGFYFRNKNVVDLRDKLEYLINNSQSLASKKNLLRKDVIINYNWDSLIEKIDKVYLTAKEKDTKNRVFTIN